MATNRKDLDDRPSHGGEHHDDSVPGYKEGRGAQAPGADGPFEVPKKDVDESWIGRKGGSDIDVEKREKELE